MRNRPVHPLFALLSHSNTHTGVQYEVRAYMLFWSSPMVYQRDGLDQRLNTAVCYCENQQCFMNIHYHVLCHIYVSWCDVQDAAMMAFNHKLILLALLTEWHAGHFSETRTYYLRKNGGPGHELGVMDVFEHSLGVNDCGETVFTTMAHILLCAPARCHMLTWFSPVCVSNTHTCTHVRIYNPCWLLLMYWCTRTNQVPSSKIKTPLNLLMNYTNLNILDVLLFFNHSTY